MKATKTTNRKPETEARPYCAGERCKDCPHAQTCRDYWGVIRKMETNGGNTIIISAGAKLEIIESDSGAYRRMISAWIDAPDISAKDFRSAVRAITK